ISTQLYDGLSAAKPIMGVFGAARAHDGFRCPQPILRSSFTAPTAPTIETSCDGKTTLEDLDERYYEPVRSETRSYFSSRKSCLKAVDKDVYTEINARTIDRWVAEGWEWGRPISHEEYVRAQRGEWHVLLTPTKPVPKSWFPDLRGAKLLGLASGGGQQMPIFAALGAECTVLDYSDAQLASEKLVA